MVLKACQLFEHEQAPDSPQSSAPCPCPHPLTHLPTRSLPVRPRHFAQVKSGFILVSNRHLEPADLPESRDDPDSARRRFGRNAPPTAEGEEKPALRSLV